MRNLGKMLQIGLTFMGTVVGAGFASGQEILQFFTRFGFISAFTILVVTCIFIWLGAKMMLLAAEINAVSYEDLNRNLFGDRLGQFVSIFMMIVLLGVTGVMLAGAGSIFLEHLNISYQTGLILTLVACFFCFAKRAQGHPDSEFHCRPHYAALYSHYVVQDIGYPKLRTVASSGQ